MTIASPRSIAIVPMIALSPTTNGSSAATMLPKTQISTTTVIGMAIDSATARSLLVRSLTCW